MGRYQPIDGARPECREEWLELVYTDETWTVQLDGGIAAWDEAADAAVEGEATSSSTMPSLMVAMLETLDVASGTRVLEIGTGTGYNAALLCERLGSSQVVSVDVDPALVRAARERLATCGYTPTVAAAEGAAGYAAEAPYDRVIATCSVSAVPLPWVQQTRPGGFVLTPLYRELGGGPLVRLTVGADGSARGHFLSTYAGFMPGRGSAMPDALDLLRAVPDEDGQTRRTAIEGSVLGDQAFVFFAALRLPQTARIQAEGEDGDWQQWLLARDGSWAYQAADEQGAPVAVPGGRRRLWDELERAHEQWKRLGEPARDRFGLTVLSDGDHVLWLDSPDGPHTWNLPL